MTLSAAVKQAEALTASRLGVNIGAITKLNRQPLRITTRHSYKAIKLNMAAPAAIRSEK